MDQFDNHDPVVSWLPESHSLVIFEAARAESIASERSKPCFARDPRFSSMLSGWQQHNQIQRNFGHLLYLESLSNNGKFKIPSLPGETGLAGSSSQLWMSILTCQDAEVKIWIQDVYMLCR